ncbi:MAG TPA: ABC transporter permease [Candidatus Sulfotelmatobacter sp.]|nr:ABC transporter permease [Candidatus Sulfotelmatobacter sp.]
MRLRSRTSKRPPSAPGANGVVVAQIGLLVGVLGLWQAGCWAGLISPLKGGSPIGIVRLLWAGLASGELAEHAAITLGEEVLGFAIGVGLGTMAALALWWLPTLSKALAPLVAICNGIPKIALAPPMIVWFGIFETSKIALAAIICLFIAWLSATEGVRRVDPDNIDMIRAMGASPWHIFRRIVIPSSLPWIVSALKVSIGFALVGAVVGEFVASNHGLGYLAVQAAIYFQISKLWMVVVVIAMIAAVQYFAVLWLERRFLHWATSEHP